MSEFGAYGGDTEIFQYGDFPYVLPVETIRVVAADHAPIGTVLYIVDKLERLRVILPMDEGGLIAVIDDVLKCSHCIPSRRRGRSPPYQD